MPEQTTDPFAGLTTTNVSAPAAMQGNVATAAPSTADTYAANASTTTGAGYTAQGYTGEGYTAQQADPAAQAQATTREVQTNETIQGQLQGIIDSNSPLIQRARARANDAANARGLVNSTMAVQAGEAAAYDVALPIAQFDAGVYGQASRDNQAALTQVSMFNAGEKNKIEMFNTDAENQASAFTANANNQANAFTANANNQANAFNADTQAKVNMFNADQQTRVSLANADAANQNARANAQLITQTNLANADAANKVQMANYDAAVKIAMQNADAANKATLVKLDGAVKTGLAEIEARYKNDMQASATAATMYQTAQQQITAIMTNPDIPPESKGAYVNNILSLTRAGMDSAGSLANVDLSRYLDRISVQGFGGSGAAGGAAPTPSPVPAPAQASGNTDPYGGHVNANGTYVDPYGRFWNNQASYLASQQQQWVDTNPG